MSSIFPKKLFTTEKESPIHMGTNIRNSLIIVTFILILTLSIFAISSQVRSSGTNSITAYAGKDLKTNTASSGHNDVSKREVIIVDTDMGLDDVRAIYALLACSQYKINAFITVEGSASLGKACDNLIGLLESLEITDIPIFRGFNEIETTPPWRKVSNTLNNTTFPPPHEIEIRGNTIKEIHKLLSQSSRKVTYLALGPLTNLRKIEKSYPGSIKKFKRIIIPARVKINKNTLEIDSWNLSADKVSTEVVLRASKQVNIVDVSRAEKLRLHELLYSLPKTSPATRWIKSIASKKEQSKHIFIYDEIAALTVINQETTTESKKKYSLRNIDDNHLLLEENKNGNITIVTVKSSGEKIANMLKDCWSKARVQHEHKEEQLIPPRILLKAFHGHLGPYVVLGYRASKLALSRLHHEGHFGIFADVYSSLKPPRSCFIDGIQLGSGCTLGKRNIKVFKSEKSPHARFSTYDGDSIKVFLRNYVPQIIDSLINVGGVEYAGDIILNMPADTLFYISQ